MELKFDKKIVKSLVEEYYRDYEDFEGTFSSSCSMQSVGYGMCEYEDCVVSMKMSGKVGLLGQKISIDKEISEEEISNIFSTLLSKKGYIVQSVSLVSGVDSSYEGYGMCEELVKRPYFNGVMVNVKQKQLIR